MTVSVVGIFCEDIRQEEGGKITLLGVLPEILYIPNFISQQTLLPRFALLVRVHFHLDDDVKIISLKVVPPEGNSLELPPVDETIIQGAYERIRNIGGTLCSISMQLSLPNFPIKALGWLRAEVTVDKQSYIAATALFNAEPSAETPKITHQLSHRF